ncbi:hypothetical protein [Pedobacter faecalis]|uniref:hypothetical protein n=1 Tax=Pedobacter faecalis TaxID=3041495 RepID=UPI00254F497D|nr:hypothetical protein [Pedobacter sp. ELA7]
MKEQVLTMNIRKLRHQVGKLNLRTAEGLFKIKELDLLLPFLGLMEQLRRALIAGGGRKTVLQLADTRGSRWDMNINCVEGEARIDVSSVQTPLQQGARNAFRWRGTIATLCMSIAGMNKHVKKGGSMR